MTRAVVVPLSENTFRRLKVAKAHSDLTGDQLIRMLIDLSGVPLDEGITKDPRVQEWIRRNVG